MKKVVIVFLLLGMYCCKKEKTKATPSQPIVVTPASRDNTMTATLNGKTWAVTANQTSEAYISQSVYTGNPKQYVIGGRTDLNLNSIHLGFAYATGTVALESFTNYYAAYIDSTGTSYPAKTGTINISLMDTSHAKSSACDKFKATFSFVTSTIAGVSYTVEQGRVDFEAN